MSVGIGQSRTEHFVVFVGRVRFTTYVRVGPHFLSVRKNAGCAGGLVSP